MKLEEYERQRVADFLEENWSQFVDFMASHYDDEAEQIAEEIVTALKGE